LRESEGKMKNEKELNICVQSGQPKEQNEEKEKKLMVMNRVQGI
jgi:hypothetical protein